MSLLLRMARRNLSRHPWRTSATVVGVALGVAAVLATLSIGENVEANLRSDLEAATGKAALIVAPGAQGRAVFAIKDALDVVEGHRSVAAAYPVLNYRTEPIREIPEYSAPILPGVDTGFLLMGRATDEPNDLPTTVIAGDMPRGGSFGIALSETFAESRGIVIGDDLAFATRFGEARYSVVGLLDGSIGLATTNGGRIGVVAIADLQQTARLQDRASVIEIVLGEGADADEVASELEASLGSTFVVVTPAARGGYAVGFVETLQSGLSILAATLVALGGFMAYNTFTASAIERRRDYALLRTIAFTQNDVLRLALLEAALIAAMGVAVGVLLGVALAYGITWANAVSLGFEFRRLVIPTCSVVLAAAVGSGVALLAGVVPARAASRISPVEATRVAEDAPQRARAALGYTLIVLGVAAAQAPWPGLAALAGSAVAMSLVFVGVALAATSLLPPALALLRRPLIRLFGTEAKLGLNFANRSAARNGVAIGTVMMGAGLIIGVGAMVAGINASIRSWVDSTVVGDLFITTPVGFPSDFARDASSIDGVDAVSGVGIRAARFLPPDGGRGRTVAVVLVEAERFHPERGFGSFQYTQGDGESGYQALSDGGRLLVASTVHARFGIEQGDTVRLRTADGFTEFGVAGVVVDFTAGGETFVAGLDELERFGGGSPDLFVATLDAGADPGTTRELLHAAYPNLFLDITAAEAYRGRIIEISQRSFASTNTLLVLAAFIAALGVANTLGMNLSQRRHEVGVLRTLGVSRSGILRLVLVEGVVVVALGALLGVGFGLLMARTITVGASALTGFALSTVLPGSVLVGSLALTIPIGIVASLVPALRAASRSPLLALRSEE